MTARYIQPNHNHGPAKKRRGRTKTPWRRVKSEQIFAISTTIAICAGSSSQYGTRPEDQRSIGASHGTPQNATMAWPATRRTKSASRVQSSGIIQTKSGTDHVYFSPKNIRL